MPWEKIPEKFKNKICEKYVVLQKKPELESWKEYRLEDLGQLQRGRSRHRPRYAFHLYGGKYPFIQTGEIREARKYIIKYDQTYSEEGLKQSKLWPKGTLCITIAANIAELAILSFDACFPDSVLGFIPNEKLADLDFIFYTLSHFQRELKHIGEGSVQDNINLGTFQNIQFPVPTLPEQKAIASILSSLDDKIDLLHRQNKTLETMAETLFRQWFVEEANDDWEGGVLPAEFDFTMGQSPPGSSYNQEGIGMSMFQGNADFSFRFPEERVYTTEPKRLAYPHDTLISVRAPVGAQNMAQKECCIGRGVAAFRYKHNNSFYTYTYFKLRSLMDEIRKFNDEGTVFGSIGKTDFQQMETFLAPEYLIEKFENEAKPLNDKVIENCHQIRLLEAMRDILLPKLMSGEIRVEMELCNV
ncbi:MAG: restriction endonuclease subunit S [Candidatus Scalindua sp. SCAELEC01]|nr:MAG: restriction endonuclease subunit S [Candidatus Scalindua sp.]NOG84655.1 restriction endonuclease subunit S [Planctomycetota bacterium]RZV92454.1 MAG: restriction endonuclease subunit S [Candidatus Scalindua sp. SCAELEC01]